MTRIVRSIENHGDQSFLVLTYGDGKIVRQLLLSPQLNDQQCLVITDAMKWMDDYVQKRLHEDGARLEYEGHVQVVQQEGGHAYDGITLHDAPFQDVENVPHWGSEHRVDNGTDLGGIIRDMIDGWTSDTRAFRGRVVVEVLDKNVEER